MDKETIIVEENVEKESKQLEIVIESPQPNLIKKYTIENVEREIEMLNKEIETVNYNLNQLQTYLTEKTALLEKLNLAVAPKVKIIP